NIASQLSSSVTFEPIRVSLFADELSLRPDGLHFAYVVSSSFIFNDLGDPELELPADSKIEFHWIDKQGARIGDAAYEYALNTTERKSDGAHEETISLSELGTPPPGTSFLQMIIDPDHVLAEDPYNNRTVTSVGTLEVRSQYDDAGTPTDAEFGHFL